MNNNILSFKENISKIKDAKSFYIKKISLKNFRNHKSLNLNLKNSSILIYGGNGSGKTMFGIIWAVNSNMVIITQPWTYSKHLILYHGASLFKTMCVSAVAVA